MPEAGQQQHVQIHRKLDLRRRLLAHAVPGPAWVPYCGDGDIAAELYAGRHLAGCDIDPERIATISARLPGVWTVGDAEQLDPPDLGEPYAVADIDAYAYPYDAFRKFWTSADKARTVALFFTDGALQNLRRGLPAGWRHPDGTPQPQAKAGTAARAAYNHYLIDILTPWIKDACSPWTISDVDFYSRGGDICYWCALATAPAGYRTTRAAGLEGEVISPDIAAILGQIDNPDLRSVIAGLISQNSRSGPIPDRPARSADMTDEQLGGSYNPLRIDAFAVRKKRQFLHLVAVEGLTLSAAARAVGITPRTVYTHFARFPEFKLGYEAACDEANEQIESSLYKNALSGNVRAQEIWLYNRAPERWNRTQQPVHMIWDDEGIALIADIISRTVTDPPTLGRVRAELARLASNGADPDA